MSRRKKKEDLVAKLMIEGLPPMPESRSTKSELRKSIQDHRIYLHQIRRCLLGSVVAQFRAGMNDGVSPETLREIADQMEREG